MKIGLLPLYLELYDKISKPGRRKPLEEFYAALANVFRQKGVEVVEAKVCRLKPEFAAAIKSFEKARVDAVVTLHSCSITASTACRTCATCSFVTANRSASRPAIGKNRMFSIEWLNAFRRPDWPCICKMRAWDKSANRLPAWAILPCRRKYCGKRSGYKRCHVIFER